MFKIIIKNQGLVSEFEATFTTQPEALAWKDVKFNAFGEGHGYTFEILDLTQEVIREIKIKKNIARMDFGKLLMAELAADNQEAAEARALTLQQIIKIETSLSDVQRLLLNGSLGLAYGLLNQLPIPHLSLDKKQAYLDKMAQFLSNEN